MDYQRQSNGLLTFLEHWWFLVIAIPAFLASQVLSLFTRLSGTPWLWCYAVGLFFAMVGVTLIFYSKLPLYRQRRFFAFGSTALPECRRLFYRRGYRCVIFAVALLFAALGAPEPVKGENDAATPPGSLSIFIASQEKIPNGRKIESKRLPQPVYIGAAPDLVLTSLQSVKKAPSDATQLRNGKLVPSENEIEIQVWLREKDVDRFVVFTSKAFRKTVLFMIDGKLLAAPEIRSKFTEGFLRLSLTSDLDDVDEIETLLQKLVK